MTSSRSARSSATPTLREILGAGHWPHAEKPDLFTRVCREFVQAATS